nr:YafY family protein [uncultured Cohaesibacter sp.]
MAKNERLLQLMSILRARRGPVTAQFLASELDVSLRTIYRDIESLRAGGALIDGAAGLGYLLVEDSSMPPQSLTPVEIEALALGIAHVQRSGDTDLAMAAVAAFAKISSSLPARLQLFANHAISHIYKPVALDIEQEKVNCLRQSCWEESALAIEYTDEKGCVSDRTVWPLALFYLEHALVLLAWCCKREAFRRFRVDRIGAISLTGAYFRPRRASLLREFWIQEEKINRSRD